MDKPRDQFKHVRRYVAAELAQYPVYQQLIESTREELAEARENLIRCPRPNDIGGGSSGLADVVPELVIKIDLLEARIKHYQWRARKTEAGLNYFRQNREIMDVINAKYFTSTDWDNDTLMERLGYATRPGKYYSLLKQITEIFGQFYGVLM